jgi:hypothetical protein
MLQARLQENALTEHVWQAAPGQLCTQDSCAKHSRTAVPSTQQLCKVAQHAYLGVAKQSISRLQTCGRQKQRLMGESTHAADAHVLMLTS